MGQTLILPTIYAFALHGRCKPEELDIGGLVRRVTVVSTENISKITHYLILLILLEKNGSTCLLNMNNCFKLEYFNMFLKPKRSILKHENRIWPLV
jgi:hypothetical protein